LLWLTQILKKNISNEPKRHTIIQLEK